MFRTKYAVTVALLLMCLAFLWSDDWDYNAGTGNWQSPNYVYYNTVAVTIQSPFYAAQVSHNDQIALGENSDFNPDDGWCLYGAWMGTPGCEIQGAPSFALYNKYTGVLRVFMYKMDVAGYSYVGIKVIYSGATTDGEPAMLFALGEEVSSDSNPAFLPGTKALDKRSELGDCGFTRIIGSSTNDGTAGCGWYSVT